MKKTFLLGMVCFAVLSVRAQIFVENFATATVGGNLEGYNNWKVSPKSTDNLGVSPKIGAGTLTYTGYISSGIGNVALLDSINGSSSSTQRMSTHYATYGADTMKVAAAGEKLYVAFLAKFSLESKLNTVRDFFTFETSKTSSNNRGRLFAKIKSNGKFVLAVSKNSTSATLLAESDSLNISDTHLIVMVYESVEGTDNDKVYVYYNPDLSKAEELQTRKISNVSTEVATDYSPTVGLGFNLRQRGIGAQIGSIRAAKSWTNVLITPTGNKEIEANKIFISSIGKSIVTSEEGTLNVFNLAGAQVLLSKTTGKLETTLNKGLYLVRFISVDGKVQSAKVEIK